MTVLGKYLEDFEIYEGDLGAIYSPDKTIFRVWAPAAEKVQLKLYSRGSSSEQGDTVLGIVDMDRSHGGTYMASLDGDYKNYYYNYLVTIGESTNETVDIYAKAVGVNGNRGMVVDLASTNPMDWGRDRHITCKEPTDAVIWETHIKDFSSDPSSGIEKGLRGKYLAFTVKNSTLRNEGKIKTCLGHLKNLGITHVHLMPCFDYATVDEESDDPESFNWGYDPKNFNVPEGSYSTNPYDGNVRINEFKQMVKSLHEENIGVIMDMVYNHTYSTDDSWFNLTVPRYYHRQNPDGSFSNGSGCGNETASERVMVRKFLIDSIIYWATEYHIDGFRFDLMAIHDTETMNLIRQALDRLPNGKQILMYGEPWCGGPSALRDPFKPSIKENSGLLSPRIACFNDYYRDAIPGHVLTHHDKCNTGFLQCAPFSEDGIRAGICANVYLYNNGLNIKAPWSLRPSQVVSYISSHDNLTFYDKLVFSLKADEKYGTRYDDLVDLNKLAAAIYITSQGLTFMQSGEEFARSKDGCENSYNLATSKNSIKWGNLETYEDLFNYYKGLIRIRQNFSPFNDDTTASVKRINFIQNVPPYVVAYTLNNVVSEENEWSTVALFFNANSSSVEITLPDDKTLPSTWIKIADKKSAGMKSLGLITDKKVLVESNSAVILVDRKSFGRTK